MTDYSETQIKKQIIGYLKLRGIFNYYLRQGLGCYPGLPDRVMHLLGSTHVRGRVVYLEVKTKTGKLSAHQEIFRHQCLADGIDYWVVRSVEELDENLSEIRG